MGKLVNKDSLSAFVAEFGQTVASCIKIVLMSHRAGKYKSVSDDEEIVILGNGPSLNDTVADSSEFLASKNLLAVNFAANTPLFKDLKPEYYVLADPHFFNSGNDNVDKLWLSLNSIDWDMVLFVPFSVKSQFIDAFLRNDKVKVRRYNTTPIEGFRKFRNFVYRRGWGMPRPRNVLIPSIMLAVNSGFKTVYVAGADHSWTRTLSVDDDNRVVSVQPHFYKDSEKETARVNKEYMNYPLYKIIYSFYVAFKSYFFIRDYAESVDCMIWNITPGSFIDAFPRKKV